MYLHIFLITLLLKKEEKEERNGDSNVFPLALYYV